jgi:hypothetical protein
MLHVSRVLFMIYRSYVVSTICIGFYLRKAEWVRAAAKSVAVMWINISAAHVDSSKYSLWRPAGLARTDEVK